MEKDIWQEIEELYQEFQKNLFGYRLKKQRYHFLEYFQACISDYTMEDM